VVARSTPGRLRASGSQPVDEAVRVEARQLTGLPTSTAVTGCIPCVALRFIEQASSGRSRPGAKVIAGRYGAKRQSRRSAWDGMRRAAARTEMAVISSGAARGSGTGVKSKSSIPFNWAASSAVSRRLDPRGGIEASRRGYGERNELVSLGGRKAAGEEVSSGFHEPVRNLRGSRQSRS